ncbi:sodium-dependent transporter [Synergistaceae bacterium OttesenSCG-928-D05]|nr:sodium-dependent transporter [Synergistaceae bacterium OttesenSCG-928-D05]
MSENREQWSSRLGFIFAAAGSAVGLGNIWRFPYITGKYGGAAFVFTYLLVVIIIGMSLMLAEFAIGRNAKQDAVGSFKKLGGGLWPIVGWMGFFSAFVILSYYAVIAGWCLAYMIKSFGNLLPEAAAGRAGDFFGAFVSDPAQAIGYHMIVMALTIAIVYKGISGGIEKCCKVLMPALFVILLLLIVRSVTLPGASKGLEFYLSPNLANLTSEGILAAIGQGFFSLSLAMGIMITYGSYIPKDEYLPSAVRSVVTIDTGVAILAGLVIFPAVFAFGIEPGAGPGLTFVTLPIVFAQMPMGAIFSFAFFLLLFIAAMTSAMSLLEVVVAYGIDQLKMSRNKSAIVMGVLVTLLGVPSALSVGGHIPQIAGKDFLDAADFVTNNVVMPLGGIFITLFVGWFWADGAKAEITDNGKRVFPLYTIWLWICRVVAPATIAIIFITGCKW